MPRGVYDQKEVRETLYRRTKRDPSATVSSVHESMILEKFRAYPTMTIAELCDSTTLTKHDAEVAIRSLKDKGVLKRVGARKRGEWIVEAGGILEVDEK